MIFRDRSDAGRQLAGQLAKYAGRSDAVVLALPRGGVPVGFAVAEALGLPLDLFLVRKLGAPAQPELAMGAVASGGVRVLNQEVIEQLGIPPELIEREAAREERELERRQQLYREGRLPAAVEGRVCILVDDGLATGSSMRAAARALRLQRPARVVIAVPVGAAFTCEELCGEVDELVCVDTPEPFFAVGQWYDDFAQTRDDEVRELLRRSAERWERRARQMSA